MCYYIFCAMSPKSKVTFYLIASYKKSNSEFCTTFDAAVNDAVYVVSAEL